MSASSVGDVYKRQALNIHLGKTVQAQWLCLARRTAMWLMNYITKNSITAPKAEKGGVKSSGNTVSVDSSEERCV